MTPSRFCGFDERLDHAVLRAMRRIQRSDMNRHFYPVLTATEGFAGAF